MYTPTLKSTAGVAIVLAAALGLAGCNKKTDTTSAPASTPAPSTPSPSSSPAVTPPASAASGAPAS